MLFTIYLTITALFLFTLFLFIFIKDELKIKLIFLIFSLLLFFFSCYLFLHFDFSNFNIITHNYNISKYYNFSIFLVFDNISLIFILLTVFIFFLSTLIAWNSIKFDVSLFFCLFLFLEYAILNVFINCELVLFYVWYESSLIPIFLIIIIWGNPDRKVIAAFYLIFYTLIFSLLFFISILFLHYKLGNSNLFYMKYFMSITLDYQLLLAATFFLAFAVKMPLFPIHLWLPEAHVESPTVGSVILASLLLKLGYFGFLRIVVQQFAEAIIFYKPVLSLICLLSCSYGALLALSQNDIKKTVAYSSVSHMGLSILGLVSGNIFGIIGSFILAIGHSFISSGLFYVVGGLYERYHTRSVDYLLGLGNTHPNFSCIFFLLIISNFGFPISINFVAEFFILIGVCKWNIYIAFSLIFYSIISVAYNLLMFVRMFHGSIKINFFNYQFNDIQKKEFLVVFPLLFLNFLLCFFAKYLINILMPVLLLI